MSYYSQKIINGISEDVLKNIVLNTPYHGINTDIQLFRNKRMYYTIQHFITKCIINKTITPTAQQYINRVYEDFFNKPWDYAYSPLLNNHIIDIVFKDQAPKVKQFRNNYYSESVAQKLYKERNNRELTDYEKNRLYAFFLKNLNTKDIKLQEVIKKEIKRIVDSNKLPRELNRMELQFYCQYIANTANDVKSVVLIGEDVPNLRGEQGDGIICINRKANNFSLAKLTKTVYHESRHAYQEEQLNNQDSVAGFEMAHHKLFLKYLNNRDYNSYNNNYHYSTIELDAENIGYYNATLFFHTIGRNDLCDELTKDRKEYLDKRNYYRFMRNPRGINISIDKFIVENLDKIIKEHPEELRNYQVLNRFYKSNGDKKSFVDILNQRLHGVDKKEMLEYYINYGIRQDELSRIDLLNSSDKSIENLINSLGSMYRNKMCTIKDYLRDTDTYKDYNKNENTYKQITITTGYELVLASKMLTFINNNFDTIVKASNSNLSNTHPLYNFLYDFRDFNMSDIKNEALQNNPTFLAKLKDYGILYKEVLRKFNNTYIRERLNNLTEEEKNSTIIINNREMTIEDFLVNYAIPRMDTHQRIIIGNEKIYISDILHKINKNKQKELQDMLSELSSNETNDRNNLIM